MAYETVCSCFRGCGAYGSCWFSGRAFGATRSSVLRTSTPQAARSPAPFRTCSNPSSSWSSGSPVLRFFGFRLPASGFRLLLPVPRFFSSPVLRLLGLLPLVPGSPFSWTPWLRLLGSGSLGSGSLGSLGPSWLSLLPRLAPHRHPAADYLRASLASMHSVAWGTFIRRSFGMSLPVVLQMP